MRFRCFEDLNGSRFCVQSSDVYRSPLKDNPIGDLERQHIELLIEEDPFIRSGSFVSLEEAIRDHELSFEDIYSRLGSS